MVNAIANCSALITQNYNKIWYLYFFLQGFSCCSLFINCLLFNSSLTELLLIFQATVPQENSLNFQSLRCIHWSLVSTHFGASITVGITDGLDTFPRLPLPCLYLFWPQKADLYKLQGTVISCNFWRFNQLEARTGDQRKIRE